MPIERQRRSDVNIWENAICYMAGRSIFAGVLFPPRMKKGALHDQGHDESARNGHEGGVPAREDAAAAQQGAGRQLRAHFGVVSGPNAAQRSEQAALYPERGRLSRRRPHPRPRNGEGDDGGDASGRSCRSRWIIAFRVISLSYY